MMESASSISKEFLEEKLQLEINTIQVGAGTNPGDNYMSTIYSVEAVLADKKQPVKYWVLKCYPSHPIRQKFANKTNMFYKELFFYTKWTSELKEFQENILGMTEPLKPAFVEFLYGDCIDFNTLHKEPLNSLEQAKEIYNPLDNFLIMTDMRKTYGFKMANRQLGLDFEHLKLVVSALGKYHAIGWAYKSHYQLETFTEKFPLLKHKLDEEDFVITNSILESSVELAFEAIGTFQADGYDDVTRQELRNSLKEFQPKLSQIMRTLFTGGDERNLEGLLRKGREQALGEERWKFLGHGDCWTNNLLFKYNLEGSPLEVLLLDHAVAREFCPTLELAYLIYTSTTYSTRKKHETDILKIYCEKFLDACKSMGSVPPSKFSLDMLKYKFHRAKCYGLATAILTLPMFLKNSDEIVDLDEIPQGICEDFADLYSKNMKNESHSGNTLFQTRIVDIAKEMLEVGVL